MSSQHSVVDYALARRAVLTQLATGLTSAHDVCDAHPYLLRAAQYHGEPTAETCPVCRREPLTRVSWVYGDTLRQLSGSARTPDQVTGLAEHYRDFAVYVVEVCRSCSWNHLVSSYRVGD